MSDERVYWTDFGGMFVCLQGMDAVFRIAIAILSHFRAQLIQCDMEGMLKCLQKDLPVLFEGITLISCSPTANQVESLMERRKPTKIQMQMKIFHVACT